MKQLTLSLLFTLAILGTSCQSEDQSVDPQTSSLTADQSARKGADDKPGDDKGKHNEPGDDKGGKGKHNEPGDDKGGKGKHHDDKSSTHK
jgi:hypothetical protein